MSETRVGDCIDCGDALEQEKWGAHWFPVLCKDCGIKDAARRKAEDEEYVRTVAAEARRRKIVNRIQNSGIKSDFFNSGDSMVKPHPRSKGDQYTREARACALLKAWVAQENDKPSVFLYGKPGLGKSWLAQAALRDAMLAGIDGKFSKFNELTSSIRKAMFADNAAEHDRDVMERWKNMPRLVIDDIGATEKPSDFTLRTAFELIDYRLHMKLPTIITANYDYAELGSRLKPEGSDGIEAERIVERIIEMSYDTELNGESHRK